MKLYLKDILIGSLIIVAVPTILMLPVLLLVAFNFISFKNWSIIYFSAIITVLGGGFIMYLADWGGHLIKRTTLLIGFPTPSILAWAVKMMPGSMKRAEAAADGESITDKTGRKLDIAILGGLALVAGLMIWQTTRTPNSAPEQAVSEQAE